jgi:Peroxidase, family 2
MVLLTAAEKNIELRDLAKALPVDEIWGVPASVIMALIITTVPLFGVETKKTPGSWTMDLDALFTGIAHDASMVREDNYFVEGDPPQPPFSQTLFDQCFVKDTMTAWDLAACNRARILDSRKNNPTADFPGIVNSALSSAIETAFMMLFGDSPLIIEGSKVDFEPSAIKALKTPIEKSDGSLSSPEVPENLISMLKSWVDDYPFEIHEYLATVVEAVIAELEALASSRMQAT